LGREPVARAGPLEGRSLADALVATVGATIDRASPDRVFVEFSGGCDSSLVLCSAVRACAERGIDPPVPVTLRYPKLPETDESEAQEFLVRHLGLVEWQVIEVDDEVDMLGPAAWPWLHAHGPVFPPLLLGRSLVYRDCRGGLVLNGEGGDEILGPRRIAAAALVVAALRRGSVPSRGAFRSLAELLPVRTTAGRVDRLLGIAPWLTAQARAELTPRLRQDLAPEPLAIADALWTHRERRLVVSIQRSLMWFVQCLGAQAASPLLDPAFIASIPRHVRRRDVRDRTTVLERHFADLLPRPIRTRRSKSNFVRAYFGRHSRAFTDAWTGEGVDPRLVDVDVLRAEWRKERPSGLSMALLQHAWLTAHGVSSGGAS
jgi:asparagine synthase (glutamine-hydrolysing)